MRGSGWATGRTVALLLSVALSLLVAGTSAAAQTDGSQTDWLRRESRVFDRAPNPPPPRRKFVEIPVFASVGVHTVICVTVICVTETCVTETCLAGYLTTTLLLPRRRTITSAAAPNWPSSETREAYAALPDADRAFIDAVIWQLVERNSDELRVVGPAGELDVEAYRGALRTLLADSLGPAPASAD